MSGMQLIPKVQALGNGVFATRGNADLISSFVCRLKNGLLQYGFYEKGANRFTCLEEEDKDEDDEKPTIIYKYTIKNEKDFVICFPDIKTTKRIAKNVFTVEDFPLQWFDNTAQRRVKRQLRQFESIEREREDRLDRIMKMLRSKSDAHLAKLENELEIDGVSEQMSNANLGN